jgi:ankyrin repeat protein
LVHAIREGHPEKVRALVASKKLDLSAEVIYGGDALMLAVILGKDQVAAELLSLGADPNRPTQVHNLSGHTPLTAAITYGPPHLPMIRALLEHQGKKADINLPDQNGVTPLQMAILGHHKDDGYSLIQYLLAQPDIDLDRTIEAEAEDGGTYDYGYEDFAESSEDTHLVHLIEEAKKKKALRHKE